MKFKALKWFGMALLLQIGLLHLYQAPRDYNLSRYLGVLFAAVFIAALIALLRIFLEEPWGWTLGAFISAAGIIVFILSRAIGFPGLGQESWLDPLGLISVTVESAFILLYWLRLSASEPAAQPVRAEQSAAPRRGLLIPAAAGALVVLVSLAAYLLDAGPGGYRNTTPISQESLANEYGVSVTQIAVTAMDSIIDTRLRIFDEKKAMNLLGDPHKQPYLLVGSHPPQVILPARMGQHSHVVRSGWVYVVFFPNPRNAIKPGTPVSLVFGDLRLDSIAVK